MRFQRKWVCTATIDIIPTLALALDFLLKNTLFYAVQIEEWLISKIVGACIGVIDTLLGDFCQYSANSYYFCVLIWYRL